MPINVYLREAVNDTKTAPNKIISSIKKQLQTCRLTKFNSQGECAKFYSSFFLQRVEGVDTDITITDWGIIYNTLLCDNTFFENMILYIAMYQPEEYFGMFQGLFNQAMSEYNAAHVGRVKLLGTTKALFSMLEMKFEELRTVAIPQVKSDNVIKFFTTVNQTLRAYQNNINRMIQDELTVSVDPDDISSKPDMMEREHEIENMPLGEDAVELIHILESSDQWIQNYMKKNVMNEGIVNNAKEKAKEAVVGAKKAERAFDEFIMKKVREIRLNRRNRKHSEMVGESLRISHEIKRLLKSGGLAIINPALGVIHWLVTFFLDKATDKKDRAILLADIKDELEIIDEKIQMAERNGDDKAKIELMRARQKYYREYERINKSRFTPEKRAILNK